MRRTIAVAACLPLLVLTACAGGEDISPAEADEIAAAEGTAPEDGSSGGTDGTADDETEPESGEAGPVGGVEADLTAMLMSPGGTQVGTVEMTEDDEGHVEVTVVVENLEPGFKGLHVHETGLCEVDSSPPDDPTTTGPFLSAGGHLAVAGEEHGDHAGDLPSLHVAEDGTGHLTAVTDGFELGDVQDADGSAVMVHEGPDNFANVPERYAPDGPDEDTVTTGDSGGRAACAVVE